MVLHKYKIRVLKTILVLSLDLNLDLKSKIRLNYFENSSPGHICKLHVHNGFLSLCHSRLCPQHSHQCRPTIRLKPSPPIRLRMTLMARLSQRLQHRPRNLRSAHQLCFYNRKYNVMNVLSRLHWSKCKNNFQSFLCLVLNWAIIDLDIRYANCTSIKSK